MKRILRLILIFILMFINTEFVYSVELVEKDYLYILIKQMEIDLEDYNSNYYVIFGGTLCPEEGIFEYKDKKISSKTLNSFILFNYRNNNIYIHDIRLRDGHFKVDSTYLIDDSHIITYLDQKFTELKCSGVSINGFDISIEEFFLCFFYKKDFYSCDTFFPNVSILYHPNIEKYSMSIHSCLIILDLFREIMKKYSFKEALKFLENLSSSSNLQ